MMQQPTHQPPAHIAGGSGPMGSHQQIGQDSTSTSPDVAKDGPASNLRKRKSPPPQGDDDGDDEDNVGAPQPPHQLQQSMDEPPQPRMTAQQQSMMQHAHVQQATAHLHPPFQYQVPGAYLPVMPVPQQQQQGIPASPPSGGSQAGGGSGGPSRVLNGSKRAEQNRKAQRAFRERRDAHVKALESRSQLLEAALASVDEANRRWEESRQMCESLRLENAQLRAALNAFQQAGTAIVQMQQMAQQNQNQEEQQQQQQAASVAAAAAAAASSTQQQRQEEKQPNGETTTEESGDQNPDEENKA
ncbi:hypothetical protein FRB97_006904 [Tulasnella sp. 331]|nr:hypothetical protein FRB97_006904 [Tulasnella sp. 331]